MSSTSGAVEAGHGSCPLGPYSRNSLNAKAVVAKPPGTDTSLKVADQSRQGMHSCRRRALRPAAELFVPKYVLLHFALQVGGQGVQFTCCAKSMCFVECLLPTTMKTFSLLSKNPEQSWGWSFDAGHSWDNTDTKGNGTQVCKRVHNRMADLLTKEIWFREMPFLAAPGTPRSPLLHTVFYVSDGTAPSPPKSSATP